MTIIRVTPSILTESGQDLASVGGNTARAGSDVWNVGASAPSYDGQFGSRVRDMAAEANARAQAFARQLSDYTSRLENKAAAFEAADRSSLSGLGLFGLPNDWREALNLLGEFGLWAGMPIADIEQYLRLGLFTNLDPWLGRLVTGVISLVNSQVGWLGRTYQFLPITGALIGTIPEVLKNVRAGIQPVDPHIYQNIPLPKPLKNVPAVELGAQPAASIAVPYISQLRWWTNPATNKGELEGGDDCGPASVAMVMSSYGKATTLPQAAMGMRGKPDEGKNSLTDFKDVRTSHFLAQNGFGLQDVHNLDDLRNQLSEHHPVLMWVDNQYLIKGSQPYPNNSAFVQPHIVVVTGYDSGTIYVNDPLAINPNIGKNWPVSVGDFQKAADAHGWYGSAVIRM